MDAVILSSLLPGVSCAEQLLAEPFLLSCLLSRPSDLPPFLSHFLPVLLNLPCWPDVSSPPLSDPHILSPRLIRPSGQKISTWPSLTSQPTLVDFAQAEEHSQLFNPGFTPGAFPPSTFQEVKNLHQKLLTSRLVEGGPFNHHCLSVKTVVPSHSWH